MLHIAAKFKVKQNRFFENKITDVGLIKLEDVRCNENRILPSSLIVSDMASRNSFSTSR